MMDRIGPLKRRLGECQLMMNDYIMSSKLLEEAIIALDGEQQPLSNVWPKSRCRPRLHLLSPPSACSCPRPRSPFTSCPLIPTSSPIDLQRLEKDLHLQLHKLRIYRTAKQFSNALSLAAMRKQKMDPPPTSGPEYFKLELANAYELLSRVAMQAKRETALLLLSPRHLTTALTAWHPPLLPATLPGAQRPPRVLLCNESPHARRGARAIHSSHSEIVRSALPHFRSRQVNPPPTHPMHILDCPPSPHLFSPFHSFAVLHPSP